MSKRIKWHHYFPEGFIAIWALAVQVYIIYLFVEELLQ